MNTSGMMACFRTSRYPESPYLLAKHGRPSGWLFSPHSFRVTVVTDLLNQNVPLEDVQFVAGHSNPTTTRILNDRRRRRVTRIVERISI